MRAALPILLAGIVACRSTSTPEAPVDAGEDASADAGACEAGTQLVAGENHCEPILAAGPCAPNTFAQPGAADCVPVGWVTACPAGFSVPADGWGCEEIIPNAACPAGKRADVQTGACMAIGDCNAAFPPAAATLFVDASYTPAEIDATHFQTINAAISAAKTGATIAVESGKYSESIGVIGLSLTIVGRCASDVVLDGTNAATSGIFSNQTLSVTGVTVTGFPAGVYVQGGSFTLTDSIVTGNTIVGIGVQGGAATVRRTLITGTTVSTGPMPQIGGGVAVQDGSADIEDSAVVDNEFGSLYATGAASTLTAARVVASRAILLAESATNGGVMADMGGKVTLSQCVVDADAQMGVSATNSGTISVSESVVRGTTGTLATNGGVGVFASTGAQVDVSSSLIVENPAVGAYVGASSKMKLTSSVVRGFADHRTTVFGRGAQATGGTMTVTGTAFLDAAEAALGSQSGGDLTVDTVYVHAAYPVSELDAQHKPILYGGYGIDVDTNAKGTVTGSSFEACSGQAISVARSSSLTATNVLVRGTLELAATGQGVAVQVFDTATFTLTGGLILDSVAEAIETQQATVQLTTVSVRGTTAASDGTFGHGLVAFTGADITLTDTSLENSTIAGLVAAGGQVRFVGGAVTNNAIAVQVQNKSFVSQSDDPGPLQVGEVRVSAETVFAGNATNLGTGIVPVPVISTGP